VYIVKINSFAWRSLYEWVIAGGNCPTLPKYTPLKSLLLLLIAPIPFDNDLQKCHDMFAASDVVNKTNSTWQDTIRRVVRQYKIFEPQ